ncbi:SNF2 family N-terminal domain-containing protein [Ephemerocybe angulata]|uniref:SNF2 family N-terminal domain-containing protein n=1 Tax=Ephemerocybe angulata TaxID=980116 RepID=A0A8H6MEL9_9AGAR|nr:SNF2 family N-terminal domain-containing protein [Tulosesus angulatus]
MAALAPDHSSSYPIHQQPAFIDQGNHIDLTGDDDVPPDDTPTSSGAQHDSFRIAKRPRIDYGPSYSPSRSPFAPSQFAIPSASMAQAGPSKLAAPGFAYPGPPGHAPAVFAPENAHTPASYRPAFAGPQPSYFHRPPPPPMQPSPFVQPIAPSPLGMANSRQAGSLPPDLAPKTPVCIGQLTVTALILYPVSYIAVRGDYGPDSEFAPVRLQYEHSPNKPGGADTIHIKTPSSRGPNGEPLLGEQFGVVEQKLPILPLQMLVYTPKGNIPVVANFLRTCGLLLDHPSPTFSINIINNYPYFNPHNPPANGHANSANHRDMRWSTPPSTAKAVEVQRSQVDELFKSLKDGDELPETEPTSDVATKLYPHQKKALTFLLEREREKPGADGKFSSLWQQRVHPISRQVSWYHIVTQQEVFEEPKETKGAILADDMGLGKTITCVSLVAATLRASIAFAASPLAPVPPPPAPEVDSLDPSHFAGSVYGMPDTSQAKAAKNQEKVEADYVRACRIKVKSRATLIICPLSTVANWEDQFREHWRGEVTVFGGNGSCPAQPVCIAPTAAPQPEETETSTPARIRNGTPLRIYIYHGNARRPDPSFLADFDAVITTFSTLASEYSKQSRSTTAADEDDEDGASSDGFAEVDESGNSISKLAKPKKGTKRKKGSALAASVNEVPSALQSVHWFRVVLDEAHSIKETATVCSRASCDLIADRRLCLTGTPVQNKLDDVFALIKFLRLAPFNDKNVWTEYIGSPCKFGQALGIARLQSIMKCITLRRTKESRTPDGKKILSLPPRRDELRYLKFDEHEQGIYDQFFTESKAEFTDLSKKNEIMKNYVGILQKILRLRQICDHFELVQGKTGAGSGPDALGTYEDIVSAIMKDGFTPARASAVFAILKEASTTQCVECCGELCPAVDPTSDCADTDTPAGPSKRGRKPKAAPSNTASRGPTRASSPAGPRAVLTKCQHLFCLECFRNSVYPNWPMAAADAGRCCSVCQTGLTPTDAIEVKPTDCPEQKKRPQKREKRQKGSAPDNYCASTKIKYLIADLLPFSRMNPYSANYDAEIQFLDGQGQHNSDDAIVKTVVFSQWTSMLDKIEDALELSGIRYDRLDGTMRRDERTRAMDALKHDPGCEVLLVSLKAGGVGLNLTAAQRHRLGQTRPVTTVKLIIQNSIEARLLEVQKRKTELANMTLGQTHTKADILNRRMEELAQLFDS